jgi:hypothetical protein
MGTGCRPWVPFGPSAWFLCPYALLLCAALTSGPTNSWPTPRASGRSQRGCAPLIELPVGGAGPLIGDERDSDFVASVRAVKRRGHRGHRNSPTPPMGPRLTCGPRSRSLSPISRPPLGASGRSHPHGCQQAERDEPRQISDSWYALPADQPRSSPDTARLLLADRGRVVLRSSCQPVADPVAI